MSNQQSDDPFAPKPEEPARTPAEPVAPATAPGAGAPRERGQQPAYEQQPAEPTGQPPTYGVYGGQPPAQPYGQPPAYGQVPPYGQPSSYGQPPAAPPYGAPQYPATPYGYAPQPYAAYGAVPYPKNNLGIWALVLGIVSFFFCLFVAGIAAIVLGTMGRHAADEGQADNRGISTAGLVLGWVNVVLVVIVVAVLVAIGASGHWTSSVQSG